MLAIFCVTGIVLVLVFRELKPLYRQDRKMFYVYASILGFALFLWLLYGFDVKVPSPAKPIKDVITAIFNLRG